MKSEYKRSDSWLFLTGLFWPSIWFPSIRLRCSIPTAWWLTVPSTWWLTVPSLLLLVLKENSILLKMWKMINFDIDEIFFQFMYIKIQTCGSSWCSSWCSSWWWWTGTSTGTCLITTFSTGTCFTTIFSTGYGWKIKIILPFAT